MIENLAEGETDWRRRGGLPALLSRALRVLPLAPLQLATEAGMHAILAQNQGMLARLGEHAVKRFAIAPVDCPFVYLLVLDPERPSLLLRREIADTDWDARISAPLVVLLGLLDGSYDGDAIFFSRDLVIEGDVAAVLALRNVIENSDLDIGRLSRLPEPLAALISTGARDVSAILRRVLDAPPGASASAHENPPTASERM